MSNITEKFDKMGIIIKIEESNDCYYCNVFRNGKMVEIPFKYYETPEDAFDETVDLIRYMVLNELKERFHNASQYHLKESESISLLNLISSKITSITILVFLSGMDMPKEN